MLYSDLNINTGHQTMSGKNRVMSDESCFTMDTVDRREVNFFKLPTS